MFVVFFPGVHTKYNIDLTSTNLYGVDHKVELDHFKFTWVDLHGCVNSQTLYFYFLKNLVVTVKLP